LPKIKAIIATHPVPMNNNTYRFPNPDFEHYKITKTPVYIITGSSDTLIVPIDSAWLDFTGITTPNKVFINLLNRGHFAPVWSADAGPSMAKF